MEFSDTQSYNGIYVDPKINCQMITAGNKF